MKREGYSDPTRGEAIGHGGDIVDGAERDLAGDTFWHPSRS